jgi:ornithine cyclodeaminase/alanine dehydrogenase-like protein (mu-crystallin family)
MSTFRYISGAVVRQLLDMTTAIGLMHDVFVQLSEGRATVPVRTTLPVPDHDARALFMPVHLPDTERVGIKVVSINNGNPSQGLPLIHALVMVLDAQTGRPLALLDGETLTAIRTGAASGLATDLLARKESTVAAIFGAGAQARTQLEAVCAVRPITHAYVFSRSADNAAAFAKEMKTHLGISVVVAEQETDLQEADIICTATTSSTPVFDSQQVKPGAHINGVGSYRPDMAEVPGATVQAARVFVDHRASCLAEAGDLIQLIMEGVITEAHIAGEIGEVAAGCLVGRISAQDVTFFKSVGNGVQDLAAASYLVDAAAAHGLGVEVEM